MKSVKNDIKTLKPSVFLGAMQYIKWDEMDGGKIGCCYSIDEFIIHDYSKVALNWNETLKYKHFLIDILGILHDDGGFWWISKDSRETFRSWDDETQTSRIIALQLAAIILKEKQSKLKH